MTNGLIYHYTDSTGLKGILTTGSLWLTDILYLNDREELTYGTGVVRDAIKKQIKELEPLAGPGPYPGDPVKSRIEILKGIGWNLAPEQLLGEPRHAVYVACFCRDGDLLSQWRGYSGGVGGFCIGFDPNLIADDEPEDPRQSTHPKRLLRDVRYGHEDGRALLDGVLEGLAPYPSAHIGVTVEFRTVEALRVLAQIKNPGFREEREVRLIVSESWAGSPDDDVSFRAGRGGLTPYRIQPIPQAAVREIVIGPGGGREQRRAVKQLLQTLDYRDVETRDSSVPFR